MDRLLEKIQGMELTRTDAAIAEYISEHLSTVGLATSTALAQEIGVSDTSVIRFIRKLGFKGYSDFRSEMNARIAEQYVQTQQNSLMPGEKFSRTRGKLNEASLIGDVCSYTLNNLEKSFSKLDNQVVEEIAEILINSNHKVIAGFRGTASCAQYMASKLLFLLPNVSLLTHSDATAVDRLMDLKRDDCLFLYSFPQYTELNKSLMILAREKGAKIILMTDRRTSPLANKADIVVVAQIDGLGFHNSYVAPMSITEVILLAVSNRCDEAGAERLRQFDEIMIREKLY